MPSSLYDVMESMERYELVGSEINFFRFEKKQTGALGILGNFWTAWFYVQVEFVIDCVSDSHY